MDTQGMNNNILQTTCDIQKSMPNQNQYVDDTIIAKHLGFSIQDVQDCLDLLDSQGLVKLLKDHDGYGVKLTALGRTWLRDPNYLQQQTGTSSPAYLTATFYILAMVVSIALSLSIYFLIKDIILMGFIFLFAILIFILIGAFKLKQENSLSEKGFMDLMKLVFKLMPSLIKGKN